MGDVSTVVAITVRGSNRPMRNNVSAVIAIAIGRSNRPVRNQSETASIHADAHRKRQNKNCAKCSTYKERATKFCHLKANLSPQHRSFT